MELKSRLDLTEIFCDVDDFYQSFEKHCRSIPQLSRIKTHKLVDVGVNTTPIQKA